MFTVSADIKYMDGWLAGMVIPAGYRCTFPTRSTAMSAVRWLTKVHRECDFVRAAVTSHRYAVVGGIELTEGR